MIAHVGSCTQTNPNQCLYDAFPFIRYAENGGTPKKTRALVTVTRAHAEGID